MMVKQNMRQIQREVDKNNRHMRYRKVSVPKGGFKQHIRRPFSNEYNNGAFRNDIYFSMSTIFIAWVYIKNLLIYCIPAILLNGVMFGVHRLSMAIVGDSYAAPDVAYQMLFWAYAICAIFGLRRVNDHMAFYNMTMLVSKYDLNQKFMATLRHSANPSTNKEITVMDHYRQQFNKYSLFPSVKELALEEQMYQKDMNSKKEQTREYAQTRRARLNMGNKRREHMAAKEIADWKQAQYGGPNEYDAMVAKYKHRTVPMIRDYIQEAQNKPNYNR